MFFDPIKVKEYLLADGCHVGKTIRAWFAYTEAVGKLGISDGFSADTVAWNRHRGRVLRRRCGPLAWGFRHRLEDGSNS